MISFVIPAHNEEALIGATIDALKSAAAETGIDAQIIVVDDASTDATGEIARSRGVEVIEVNRRQIGAVRNAGAQHARGDVIVFVDADTIVPADTLRATNRVIESGAVGGGARVHMDGETPFSALVGIWLFCRIYFRFGWAAGCYVSRRDVFERIGGFDERFYAGEETYLSRDLKLEGRFVVLREHVITSGRKFRLYSTWQMILQALRVIVRGPAGAMNKDVLQTWYDGMREKKV